MASMWCVDPERDRLDLEALGHPFWIDVKRELTVGEQRKVETAGFRGVVQGAETRRPGEAASTEIAIDWRTQSFARTEVYLLDWSLADDKGNKLKISRDVVESLKQPVYAAIETGITAHVEAQAALIKNDPSSGSGPRAISA